MGLLDSLVPALLERRQSIENPATPLSEWFGLLSGRKTKAGARISEESALAIASVWRAVNLISQQVATIPIHAFQTTADGGKDRLRDNRVAALLNRRPNPAMSAAVLRETLQSHVLTWGNGYAEIENDGAGRPRALWPITPDRVSVMQIDGVRGVARFEKFFVVNLPDGGMARVNQEDMLHIPGLGWNGTLGRSVISMARESLGLTKAAEEFGSHFFGQGTRASGVLQAPQGVKFNETTIRQLRESWDRIQGGLENSHRMMILQDGLTWQQTSIPPDDAQFLETRNFQLSEVARWFGVNPHKLYDLTRSTFSNIESQAIEFDKDTILPWVIKWEQELTAKLFSDRAQSRMFLEFIMEGVLRADTATQTQHFQTLIDRGVLSINEVRSLLNRNAIEGGDKHFISAGGQPILVTDIGELPDPPPEPSPPPPDPDDDPPARSVPHQFEVLSALVRREAERVVQREVDLVGKILNDTMQRQDVAGLKRQLAAFYVKHADWAADRLSPIMRDQAAENLETLQATIDSVEPDRLEHAVRTWLDQWRVALPATIARRIENGS